MSDAPTLFPVRFVAPPGLEVMSNPYTLFVRLLNLRCTLNAPIYGNAVPIALSPYVQLQMQP